MQRRISALLCSRVGFFFSRPAISSLQAVNFGAGCSNPRIKSPTKARVVATPRWLAAVILAALFPAWPLPVCATVFSKPKRAQRKSRAVLTILLVAALALAAASGAKAQPVLPSNTNPTTTVNSPPFTEIQGSNTITVAGTAVDVEACGNLTIDSTTGTKGPISITNTTTGFVGVQTIGASSIISIKAGASAPVTITSAGPAWNVLQGASATANANGGTLTLTNGSGFGVVVQSFTPATTPSTLTLNGANVSGSGPLYNGGLLVGGGGPNSSFLAHGPNSGNHRAATTGFSARSVIH